MAEFDQPALWEYIMKVTGVEKITYIGHSQGTTQMFASLSLYPEFY
jgi:pimeloyl-ACP methyl ester carboxylesterase